MDQVEFELRTSLLFLKQSIENFEQLCKPKPPLEHHVVKYQPYVPELMRLHSKEVKVYRLEETRKHKKRTL